MRRSPPSLRRSFARDFSRRVRRIVATLHPCGAPGVTLVAATAETSTRTLQRRLHEAGLTYAGLVQQARCAFARQMLRDTRHTIGDVARALGYSDPAHFTRAFHGWTGVTPREFRRRTGKPTKGVRGPRRGRLLRR